MFAKTIIDSDSFLDMPLSTQALYFHLSMRADDEGFINNPRKIQRMIGASDDDMKLLIAKSFVILFESGIIVIKHWKIHNYIRGDRLQKTKYQEERQLLEVKDNGAYTLDRHLTDICQSNDGQVTDICQQSDSIGKDRIGKDSIGEYRVGKNSASDACVRAREAEEAKKSIYSKIVEMYHRLCPSYPKILTMSENRKRAINARMKSYSVEDFERLFRMAESSAFLKGANDRNWSADFDWLITDRNMARVLEGKYGDDRGQPANTFGTRTKAQVRSELKEIEELALFAGGEM